MFEILEHTADIGLRARGPTAEAMFAAAAEALVSIAIETEDIRERERYPLHAAGDDLESLLVNWLSEVLYLVDGAQVAARRFEVRLAEHRSAEGAAWGERRDAARHRGKLVVKGVTYHQLRIAEDGGGWMCEVYLDV